MADAARICWRSGRRWQGGSVRRSLSRGLQARQGCACSASQTALPVGCPTGASAASQTQNRKRACTASSNPSFSASSSQALYRLRRVFLFHKKTHRALTLLLLASPRNLAARPFAGAPFQAAQFRAARFVWRTRNEWNQSAKRRRHLQTHTLLRTNTVCTKFPLTFQHSGQTMWRTRPGIRKIGIPGRVLFCL